MQSITHSLFHPRLKTFIFCKSFPLQPFYFFFRTDVYCYFSAYPFLLFSFSVLHFLVVVSCGHVGFRAHVIIASRIVSYRIVSYRIVPYSASVPHAVEIVSKFTQLNGDIVGTMCTILKYDWDKILSIPAFPISRQRTKSEVRSSLFFIRLILLPPGDAKNSGDTTLPQGNL